MEEIDALSGKDVDELLAARQEKFRSMGRDAVAPV